jgi:uncharacterized protein YndB with AHSA1/START domain
VDGNVLQVEKVIPAPPGAIFDLLADANRHPDIDGSGSVKAAKPGAPERLELGSTFGMSMKVGVGYTMENTVIEFEIDRRIAWQARPPGVFGKFTGGRIWRYELEPAGDGTKVTESWDLSQDHQRTLLRLGSLPRKTQESMERTLDRIAELTATST